MNLFRRIYDKLFINYSRISNQISSNCNEILDKKVNLLNDKIYNLEKKLSLLNTASENIKYFNNELLLLKDNGKKKILIVGFYGAPNLGDELMLETLLQYFPSFEDIDLTIMLADNADYDIDFYPAVNVIHYPKTRYDFNLLAQHFDTLIFGGGAIIDDRFFSNNDSYRSDLGTILIKLSEKFILWKKQVFSIGLSSISNFSNKEYVKKLSFIIENSTYFSVRDINSFNTLDRYCNCDSNKIKVISDIVLANKKLKYLDKELKKVNDIGIVWIPYDDNIQLFKNTLLTLTKKYKVHLIPFYGYVNFDTSRYNDIVSELNMDNVIIEKMAVDTDELISIFGTCDFLIAMRYHAVLIGNLLGIPTLSICYDKHPHYNNKMKFLSELFDSGKILYASEITAKSIDKSINIALDKKNSLKKEINRMKCKSQEEIEDIISLIIH